MTETETIHTSTGPITSTAFVGLRSSGRGFALTADDAILEVAQRGDEWRAVRRVAPDTVPARALAMLPAHLVAAARQAWCVAQGTHVYVIVGDGVVGEKWHSGIPELPHYTDRAAVVRRAQSLVAGTVRVLLVPRDQVEQANLGSSCEVVWMS